MTIAKHNRNIIISIIFIYISFALNYLVNMILAKQLGELAYGNYAIIIRIASILSIIFLLGKQMSIINALPKYLFQQQWGLAHGYLNQHGKQFAGLCVFVTIIQIVIFYLHIYHPQSFPHFSKTSFYLFIWLVPLYAMMEYLNRALQALQQLWWALIPYRILQFLLIIALLGILQKITGYFDLVNSLLITGLSILLVVIIQSIALFYKLPGSVWKTVAQPVTLIQHTNPWLFLSATFFECIKVIDLLLLKWLDIHIASTAIFAIILMFGSLFWYTGLAIRFSIVPQISSLYSQQEFKLLKTVFWQTALKTLSVMGAIYLIFIIYGQSILLHFGTNYQQGYFAMLIVLFAIIIEQTVGLSVIYLQVMEQEKKLMLINLTTLITMIVLDVIFIPSYGLMAAAIAFAFARTAAALCRFYFIKKYV